MELDRFSGKQPLYLQLATVFRRRIETGLWPRGEQAPTLDVLMRESGLGRVTIRSALAELENEGLLVRARGRGTFIRDLPVTQTPRFVLGTRWSELVARGNLNSLTVSGNVAEEDAQALPGWCQHEGKAAQSYCLLERVYSRTGTRVCYSRVYLESTVFGRLREELAHQAVITVLGRDPETRIGAGRQTVTIIAAGDDTAQHLEIPIGSPVAEITRRIYDDQGTLLYWACVHYDSRYMQLDFDLFQ